MMTYSIADEGWPEVELQFQRPDKYHQARHDQHRRIDQGGLPREFVAGVAGNADQYEQGNDQAERLEQHAEQHSRAEDEYQWGDIELVNFFCGGPCG